MRSSRNCSLPRRSRWPPRAARRSSVTSNGGESWPDDSNQRCSSLSVKSDSIASLDTWARGKSDGGQLPSATTVSRHGDTVDTALRSRAPPVDKLSHVRETVAQPIEPLQVVRVCRMHSPHLAPYGLQQWKHASVDYRAPRRSALEPATRSRASADWETAHVATGSRSVQLGTGQTSSAESVAITCRHRPSRRECLLAGQPRRWRPVASQTRFPAGCVRKNGHVSRHAGHTRYTRRAGGRPTPRHFKVDGQPARLVQAGELGGRLGRGQSGRLVHRRLQDGLESAEDVVARFECGRRLVACARWIARLTHSPCRHAGASLRVRVAPMRAAGTPRGREALT